MKYTGLFGPFWHVLRKQRVLKSVKIAFAPKKKKMSSKSTRQAKHELQVNSPKSNF